jgi:1-acyl-sn-glycerol-3-phosphate acyltransferase
MATKKKTTKKRIGPAGPPAGPSTPSIHAGPSSNPSETSSFAPPPLDPNPSVDVMQNQIRDLEDRLDRMIQKAERKDADERSESERIAREITERLRPPAPVAEPGDQIADPDAAPNLLSSDYYAKQWGRAAIRDRSEEVDDFGLDPKFDAQLRPLLDFLYQRYFRVETRGASNIPDEGRCLIVANHSGTFPYDGAMLKTAMRLAHPKARDLRWLAEDFVFYLPFVGTFMNRIGAVRGCQENAERLLRQDRLVGVFPEGVKGVGKLFRDRYRLQRFGRGGYIKLCLRTGTPIVPCAVIGAEESNPMLHRFEYLASAFGIPYFPVTPTFPALGPLGLIPAPTKWRIIFGEVIRFDNYGPEAQDDSLLVAKLSEKVRTTVQAMLDQGLAERQSVWLG